MNIAVRRLARACFFVIVALLVGGIGAAIVSLPTEWTGLQGQVAARLDESGVHNPVTAVLLNFRGYDTLLEIGVLLVAALAVRGLAPGNRQTDPSSVDPPGSVLTGLLRLVAPLIVIVAGYLLWAGNHAAGGAFQAGALLASLGVLIILCDPQLLPRMPDWIQRVLLSAGLFVFIGAGLAPMALRQSMLQYPPHAAKWLILLIEAACTVSIAMVLTVLFAGGVITSSRNADPNKQRENPL
jgi:multisubunit Na+/H+ antiporter MnhB subunit